MVYDMKIIRTEHMFANTNSAMRVLPKGAEVLDYKVRIIWNAGRSYSRTCVPVPKGQEIKVYYRYNKEEN